jgi:hypothetical protein
MEEVALFAIKVEEKAGVGARRARLSPESGDQGISRGADPVIKNR